MEHKIKEPFSRQKLFQKCSRPQKKQIKKFIILKKNPNFPQKNRRNR
jgi:hypothetical protein